MSAAENIDGLLDALAPEGDITDERWEITDLGGADWASRKITQANRKIAAAQTERDRLVARIDEWAAKESKAAQREVDFFTSKLVGWLQREIDADPEGKKSRDLPSGVTVKKVSGRERLVVEDEPTLVEWLRSEAAELVSFVPKVDAAGVKKYIRVQGDVPPGARLVRSEDSFTVVTP